MSRIEWTDRSDWNPLRGCTRVSEGCRHCYAEAIAARFSGPGQPFEGFAEKTTNGPRWTGKIALMEDRLTLPLKWRKPAKIFVNSASDLFHENVPDEWIDRIFAVMALAPQHTFQVLTKRPTRMRAYMENKGLHPRVLKIGDAAAQISYAQKIAKTEWPWPLPNVWLGVTAEDQPRADERVPELLATPAARRFISAEPLLGAVNLRMTRWATGCPRCEASGSIRVGDNGGRMCPDCEGSGAAGDKFDWVICGGESGPGARPMHPQWARDLRDQCKAAATAFFFKQWGEWAPHKPVAGGDLGGDMRAGRVRQIRAHGEPDGHFRKGDCYVARVGKARAGRLLDGVEHSEFPT